MTPALLEPGHLFSQHSLNTYLRCPQRFLLKYIDRQPWPMPEDDDPEAYDRHLERGRIFHQWVARSHLGLDMEPIVAGSDDGLLQRWWRAYKGYNLDALPTEVREAELALVVPLGDYRLYARYDLLALDCGGDAVIVDWKTLETVPSSRTLRQRVQTRVYLYTLLAAGHVLTGGIPIQPERASMVYWFSNHPERTEVVRYSTRAFQQDARDLRRLVETLASQPREAFHLTDNERECVRCNYRTLCHRAEGPLPQDEVTDGWLDEDIDFDIDVSAAAELDY
ncbi:MAG: PD-(D/E)XK nuclease family protein [Anaerolineae bacterium]